MISGEVFFNHKGRNGMHKVAQTAYVPYVPMW